MKKFAVACALTGLILASVQKTEAHQPEGVLYFLWQWPAGMPVLDTNLSEWEVLPEEYWFSNADFGTKIFQSEGQGGRVTTGMDPGKMDMRYAVSANAADNRFYFAYERFDNAWTAWADIEPKIDADHSAGSFWVEEGMTEEEAKRAKSRGAQPYHLFFSGGGGTPGFDWSWNWQTAADWYEDPRFMDAAYAFSGEPLSNQEYFVKAEFYLSGFNGIAHNADEPRPYAVILSREALDHPIAVIADYYLSSFVAQPSWIQDDSRRNRGTGLVLTAKFANRIPKTVRNPIRMVANTSKTSQKEQKSAMHREFDIGEN